MLKNFHQDVGNIRLQSVTMILKAIADASWSKKSKKEGLPSRD